MSDPKGEGKTKGKGKSDDQNGKAKGKGKKGKETRVCHECNKPGHLRKDCTVYKKRMAEKGGNREKTETTAAVQGATVQGAMIETWKCTEDDFVFAFGETVIAAVQRPETHICIGSGASRSACPFAYAPDVLSKGTAQPLFSIDGSPIEQRGCKKMHWEKRDSAGEKKRTGSHDGRVKCVVSCCECLKFGRE